MSTHNTETVLSAESDGEPELGTKMLYCPISDNNIANIASFEFYQGITLNITKHLNISGSVVRNKCIFIFINW